MNPNDLNNQNNNQSTVPQNQNPVEETKVDSIAKVDEVPMSISPLVEEVNATEPVNQPAQTVVTPEPTTPQITINETTPVETNGMFNQNNTFEKPATNTIVSETPVTSAPTPVTETKESLLNFQTNSINTNTNVNINDFRIAGEDKKEEIVMPTSTETASTLPSEQPVVTQTAPKNNQTAIFAVVGVVLFGLIAGGAYLLMSRSNTSTKTESVVGKYQTEKIAVSESKEIKELTEEEYKTIIKSYIERYNKNVENSKLRLSQPNLTQAQQANIFMDYSTEVLDIYTGIQNLKVPAKFKDQHEKLTLSLYALNSLFDTVVKTLKEGKSNTPISATLATISKAEALASSSFNEIVTSK